MIQSVDRAARMMFALARARSATLTELAAMVGLPASTTHGIVQTLVSHHLVEQDRAGHYRLGPALLRLGTVYLDTLELRARAAPLATQLSRRTGLSVRVAVREGAHMMVICQAVRPGDHYMHEVGTEIPIHACALGKAVLAYEQDLAEVGFSSMTGATVTDAATLGDQLEIVRASGLAVERDEAVLGESGLAAPILDATGVVGAFGLVIPSTSWPVPDAAPEALRDVARSLSVQLGAPRWPS